MAGLARLVRGQILTLREQAFMQAADVLGLKDSRKIIHHLVLTSYRCLLL